VRGAEVGDHSRLFEHVAAALQQFGDAQAWAPQRTAVDLADVAKSEPLVVAGQTQERHFRLDGPPHSCLVALPTSLSAR
jgi:hypothetical protein